MAERSSGVTGAYFGHAVDQTQNFSYLGFCLCGAPGFTHKYCSLFKMSLGSPADILKTRFTSLKDAQQFLKLLVVPKYTHYDLERARPIASGIIVQSIVYIPILKKRQNRNSDVVPALNFSAQALISGFGPCAVNGIANFRETRLS